MMKPRTRIVMVGLETHPGQITRIVQASEDLEIVGLADDPRNLPPRANWKLFAPADYERMYDELQPQIVGVACRHSEKVGPICAAIERGIHVMADKPLCTETDQLGWIRTAAEKQPKVRVGMLLTLRASPFMQRMRDAVRSGDLGEIVCAYAKRCFALKEEIRPGWYWDDAHTGGPTVELSLHDVDAVQWMTGLACTEVVAHERKGAYPQWPNFTASGASCYRLANGGSLLVEYSRHVQPPLSNEIELHLTGTKGSAVYRLVDKETLWLHVNGSVEQITELPSAKPLFREWVDTEGGTLSTSETLNLMNIVLSARESARTGEKKRLPS